MDYLQLTAWYAMYFMQKWMEAQVLVHAVTTMVGAATSVWPSAATRESVLVLLLVLTVCATIKVSHGCQQLCYYHGPYWLLSSLPPRLHSTPEGRPPLPPVVTTDGTKDPPTDPPQNSPFPSSPLSSLSIIVPSAKQSPGSTLLYVIYISASHSNKILFVSCSAAPQTVLSVGKQLSEINVLTL